MQASNSIATLLATVQRPATHVAELNGHKVEFNVADYEDAVEALVAKHGPGIPAIRDLAPAISPTVIAALPLKAPVSTTPPATRARSATGTRPLSLASPLVSRSTARVFAPLACASSARSSTVSRTRRTR